MPSSDNRDFNRIVKIASALSLGVMAGFIYSVKSVHPSLVFQFSLGTFLVTILFGGLSWGFFGLLFREESKHEAAAS